MGERTSPAGRSPHISGSRCITEQDEVNLIFLAIIRPPSEANPHKRFANSLCACVCLRCVPYTALSAPWRGRRRRRHDKHSLGLWTSAESAGILAPGSRRCRRKSRAVQSRANHIVLTGPPECQTHLRWMKFFSKNRKFLRNLATSQNDRNFRKARLSPVI